VSAGDSQPMRWARRHHEALPWVRTGPRWHLVTTIDGVLVSACRRTVPPPFDVVSETPRGLRCRRCDSQVGAVELSDASGTPRAKTTPAADTQRELLRLRAIVVSGQNALRKTTTSDGRELVKDRVTELLAQLEEAVIRDGGDPEVLTRIDEARRQVWD
jgi:hypothetical protein